MVCELTFMLWGAAAHDEVGERHILMRAAKAARLKRPQAVTHFHADWQRFSKYAPRFVRSPWQRTDLRKFFLSVFGSIAPTEGPHHPNKLASEFEAAFDHRAIDKLA